MSHCTEVGFASFLSGGITKAALVNPPKKKKLSDQEKSANPIKCYYFMTGPRFILLLSRFFRSSLYPDFIQILSSFDLNL